MLKQLEKFLSDKLVRTYSPGMTVLYQGEVPRAACIVKSGVIRAMNISPQGDEQTVTYHIAGEVFPVSWLFSKAPGALFFYEAVTKCEIYFVSRPELTAQLARDPLAQSKLMDYLATMYTASLIRISALEQPKAREKILYTLYYLCQRYGVVKSTGTLIRLDLTHQQFASLVGLTRETTATELNKLKRQKVINYDNQHYRVHVLKLVKLIGEESFENIRIK